MQNQQPHFLIQRTDEFNAWMEQLRDNRAGTAIMRRLRHVALGHLGDAKPVGDKIFEIRIHYGPGYRLYYTHRQGRIILLLCAGDKSSQARDIQTAKKILSTL